MSILQVKYPDGQWEIDKDQTCPTCNKPLEVFTVEEPTDTGRMVKYNKAERCKSCGWIESFKE